MEDMFSCTRMLDSLIRSQEHVFLIHRDNYIQTRLRYHTAVKGAE
jgi:hypothetical protein